MRRTRSTGAAQGASRALAKRRWGYTTLVNPIRETVRQYRVVRRLSAIFDVTLGPLALVMVSLLVIEFLLRLSPPWNIIIYGGQLAIWGVFLLAFAVELSLAPHKLRYVRRNWLLVVSLAIPALRVLRAAQALRFLRATPFARGANVVRSAGALNRAMNAIRGFLAFSQLMFLVALTFAVWLTGAGLVYYLESDAESEINGAGDALWWAATVLTTVGVDIEPVSAEGRVVAIGMRVYGVAVIGYFTARLAAFFLGKRSDGSDSDEAQELRALRVELAGLREELEARRNRPESADRSRDTS